MITVSLREIYDARPCSSGFVRVLHARGKITDEMRDELIYDEQFDDAGDLPNEILSLVCDEQFPAASVVVSDYIDGALWALRIWPEHENLWRKYAVWCARQVQHLMTDERSIAALEVAWRHSDGLATDEELQAAEGAAWDAVQAAWATARDAAWAAAVAAERAAAGATAWDAAWDAARATQTKKLIEILNAGQWVDDQHAQEERE